MDLLLSIGRDGQLRTSLYDKRDDFNFHITNFPFLSSNIPSLLDYGVFISQLKRYSRACSSYECFILRAARLSSKLLGQGYVRERLKSSLRKFYGRYGDFIKYYEVPLSQMLHEQLASLCPLLPPSSTKFAKTRCVVMMGPSVAKIIPKKRPWPRQSVKLFYRIWTLLRMKTLYVWVPLRLMPVHKSKRSWQIIQGQDQRSSTICALCIECAHCKKSEARETTKCTGTSKRPRCIYAMCIQLLAITCSNRTCQGQRCM